MSTALQLVESTANARGAIRAALYLRVSTRADRRDDEQARQRKRQEVDNQRRQLRQFCNAGLVLDNGRLRYFSDLDEAIAEHHRLMAV